MPEPVPAPTFVTRRLVVRPAVLADAPFFHELWTNPDVMKHVGFPRGLPITVAEIEHQIQAQQDAGLDRRLVAELKRTGQRIGQCKLGQPNEEGLSETDVKLLPAFWGHRYGVELKRGLVNYLFTHTDCRIVQATPNVDNIASIKMQEAVGGIRVGEGVSPFPESMQSYTTAVHHYIYHVHRSDWPAPDPDQ
jgi:ribosomal-protein-alanine N-acetyltransferase